MISDKKQPSVPGSSVEISPPEKSTGSFVDLVSQVLAWNNATQPEHIEKWRDDVRKLVKDPKTEFHSYFPADKEEWRTKHVITWLAGCAPDLEGNQLLYLNKQEIAIESLLEGFHQPAASRQAQTFPYNLTAGTYDRIHFALVRHMLISPGSPCTANTAIALPTTPTKPPLMSSENMTPNLREKFAGIDRLREQFQSLAIRTSQPTYTTLSGYHAALVEQKRWHQEDNEAKIFPTPSAHARALATKIGDFGNVERGASERKTIQPAWSAFLKRLGCIQKDLAVEMFDRHKGPTIGKSKPDLVGYFKEACQCEYNMCLVGELKSIERSNSDSFGAEDFGQLELFMERLLNEYQPDRSYLYGFLSDGRIIQYLYASRHKDGLKFTTHSPQRLTAEEGIGFLCELMMTSRGETTAQPLIGSPAPILLCEKEPQSALTVTRFLGQGRTAFVFEVKLPNGSCAVAKIFKPDCLDDYRQELRFLQAIANVPELEGRVSKLVVSSPPVGYLFLSPVGVHFACSEVEYSNTRFCATPQPDTVSPKGPQFVRAKPSTFAELVSILKVLHNTVKIVHRDIRANNIFQTATGQVFLIDLGSATQIGEATAFAGALEHAPDEVLDHYAKYTPKASDDLVMLIRAAFEVYNPNLFHDVHRNNLSGDERNQWIKKCWRHFFPVQSHWFTMQQAALSQNYDHLQRLFQECLPAQAIF